MTKVGTGSRLSVPRLASSRSVELVVRKVLLLGRSVNVWVGIRDESKDRESKVLKPSSFQRTQGLSFVSNSSFLAIRIGFASFVRLVFVRIEGDIGIALPLQA